MTYPAGILALATTTVSKISSLMEDAPTLGAAATEVIAEALMAERERCRLIAVDVAQEAEGGEYYIAHLIASAIRSGEHP